MANIIYLSASMGFMGEVFINPFKAFDTMMDEGVMHYARRLTLSNKEVWKAVLKRWANGYDVTKQALQFFDDLELDPDNFLGKDDDYLLSEIEDNMCEPDCETAFFGATIVALDRLGIKYDGNLSSFIKSAKKLIPANNIRVMVNIEKLWEFRDKQKDEQALAEFCVYLAMKSIVGRNSYAKSTIAFIMQRAFPDPVNQPENALRVKYATRHRWSKLIKAMQLDWHVKVYSRKTRGLYFAFDKDMTLKKLAKIAEIAKEKYRNEQVKKLQDAAQKEAKEELKNGIQ